MRFGYGTLLVGALILGLALGASFGGGAVWGRTTAKTPTPAPQAASLRSSSPGGTRGGGTANLSATGNTSAANAAGSIGTLESIQGNVLTVRTAAGTTAQYSTSATTQVSAAQPSSLASLKQGDLVEIGAGQPDTNGQQVARSVLVLPARQGAQRTPGALPSITPGVQATGTAAIRQSGSGRARRPPVTPTP